MRSTNTVFYQFYQCYQCWDMPLPSLRDKILSEMNDMDNGSHKRTLDELDLEIKDELDSNNHHNNEELDELIEEVTDGSEPPAKKVRASEELDIRFLVSSKEAGAIIGKGGANINHLRKHSLATTLFDS
ncbi:unnamed protein product [Oppiella nova]|uniref:K Homology domain-containing protein n=1 Tax=Oppiella nova TaxID=334625 RepID=A0A7R9LNK4_9ACAR|nr:unnamed protein product [Oppiella nova]CAG2165419.1 unnamed protein product [Oppiella nova]